MDWSISLVMVTWGNQRVSSGVDGGGAGDGGDGDLRSAVFLGSTTSSTPRSSRTMLHLGCAIAPSALIPRLGGPGRLSSRHRRCGLELGLQAPLSLRWVLPC